MTSFLNVNAQTFSTQPSSFSRMSVADNTKVSFDRGYMYAENMTIGDGVDFSFVDATNNDLFLAGDTSKMGNSSWNLGTSTSTLNFVASPIALPSGSVSTGTNYVVIHNPSQVALDRVNLMIPAYSTYSNIVLKETSDFQNLNVLEGLTYPSNHFLYLGDIEKETPTQDDTANRMTLSLAGENNTINGNTYDRSYYVITPGRSRLGRYILANGVDDEKNIFPVGDNSSASGFAPVRVRNQIGSANAMFYVTASRYLYDWDTSFRTPEDIANPVFNRRQNNVKKHWVVKSDNTSRPSLNVILKLQHAGRPDIEEEDYEADGGDLADGGTIISRYIGATGSSVVLNRNTITYADVSTPSYSYWENITGISRIDEVAGNKVNIVPGRSDDVTHIAYITDFRNDYPLYMKAGFAQDSMPMGEKMVVPCWDTVFGEFIDENQAQINYPASCQYRITGYKIYYTTDKSVAEQNFPDGSNYAVTNSTVGLYAENETVFRSFTDSRFNSKDTTYIKLIPIPSSLPYDNVSVTYVPSPVGIVLPNIYTNDDLLILNNPISTLSDDELQAILPKKITEQIAAGECYFIEPTSKVTINRKALERIGSSFGYKISLSSNPVAPGIYTILIRVKFKDGSQKDYISKVIVQ